jgi:plastocyanin
MIRILTIVVASLAIAAAAAAANTPQKHATLTISHQMRGCHSWALNGGPSVVQQVVSLARGGTITVVDNDVMPHKLVQLGGSGVKIVAAQMSRAGAKAQVTFTKAGVYKFATKAGDDYAYAKNIKTIGEDNVLRLTVVVA